MKEFHYLYCLKGNRVVLKKNKNILSKLDAWNVEKKECPPLVIQHSYPRVCTGICIQAVGMHIEIPT